jgi:hypothetical protein
VTLADKVYVAGASALGATYLAAARLGPFSVLVGAGVGYVMVRALLGRELGIALAAAEGFGGAR